MSTPASPIDLTPPFDPTAYTSITGAQLFQLVSGLIPFTDKGMIVMTTDDIFGMPNVPNATTTTKWQNYLWLRNSASVTGLYIWCPTRSPNVNIGVDYLQWYPLGIFTIPAGSILGSQIATGVNGITDININDVDWSKITNVPAFVPATGSVTAQMLQDSSVTAPKIAAGGLVGNVPRISADGIDMEFFQLNPINQLAPPTVATAGLPVAVNVSGTGFVITNWNSAGATTLITHREENIDVSSLTTNNNLSPVSAPTTAKGVLIPGLTITNFTPQAASIFVIEVGIQVCSSIVNSPVFGAIFDDTDTCVAAAMAVSSNLLSTVSLVMTYVYTNTDVTAKGPWHVYFGPCIAASGPTAHLNENASSQRLGNFITSYSRITEFA